MANKHQVIALHAAEPGLTPPQIADRLDCDPAYVRATAQREGLKLPSGLRPPSAEARLQRAAPDMLAALTDCLAALTDPVVGTIYGDDPEWYRKVDAAADKARAAIAKATGA